MYNYYSYLKQLKQSQSKENILLTDNDFRKKVITKNKLIENNTKKLKKEVFKLSQEPIIIHKYRDAPSTYFNSNKINSK